MSREIIEEYWDRPDTVSLIDQNLRILETESVLRHLSSDDVILDLGCGAAESTVMYARAVSKCVGLEQSKTMLEKAEILAESHGISNIDFIRGDALSLGSELGKFDVVISQRVVINFMTWDEQKIVLNNAIEALKIGGKLILIENTFEGFENLNSFRRELGLPNIKLHDWHNYFLVYGRFKEFMSHRMTLIEEDNFNTYYLLTRVFGNLIAKFEGFGSNATKDPIFEKIDYEARQVHSKFNEKMQFKLGSGSSFGPIQMFVFQKTP